MSSLKAFGFQVRKGKTKDAQWSDSSTCTKAADHNTLPWLAPSAKQPPVKAKSTIDTTKSASIEPVLKKKATSSASKSNTITRYFTRTPTTTATPQQQGISMKNDTTNANIDAGEETCLCVVRKRIPITSIWSTLLEEYSFSVDDSDDPSDDDFYYGHVEQHKRVCSREDMMMLDTVMTSMEPRGTRRKIRDDDDEDDMNGTSHDRQLHSRMTNMLKEMEQEQDDQDDGDEEEDRTRNVRKRMTQEEAATLLHLITEEFLLY
ncbi:predicted protein [Lichtheimia corymbifera JMRC:FSU:9682]|uniref:Uncharacterized protein n=1 Tax=Lichtheimia corymbifera JMRC:FSU:9682 TaxID=1263082 RepID=A0A068RXF9_9FUNG|nr:predicted protein [Lichtheimia corymbifera JMRC:FSU:9682]